MRSTLSLTLALTATAALALTACTGDDDTGDTEDTDVFDTGDTGDTGTEDTTPPTVTITDDVAGTADGDVTFTFTFSEDVGDSFVAEDITVSGGTAGAFSADGTTATLVVSPPAEDSGTIEIDVAAGTFEDLAGNANEDPASATQDYDTTVPAVQTVLIDFEEDPPVVSVGFGDIDASIVEDPTDSTNTVAQVVKPDIAPTWAGVTFAYCPNDGTAALPFDETHTSIAMRVWSPDSGVTFRMKVENSLADTISVETEATTTVASAWETLVFDFSNEAEGTAAINLDNTYDKLSVFPNFGTDGATAGAKTYFVDDITFIDKDFANDCPEPPENLLANPGLEDWPETGLPTGWSVFPGDRTNYAKVCTGDEMFNTSETFVADEGSCAIKLYGIYNGVETETPIYQEFSTSAGQSYTMTARAYMHAADAIAADDTYLSLQLKFFTEDYSGFSMVESDTIITNTTDTNTWHDLEVSGTVPDGFSRVQAAIEFWHCVDATGDCFTGGGVYVDDVTLAEIE